jgi:tetratricopeptide (TPR) repeat protein
LRINPNDALAYYDRGIVRVRLGEFQGAIADYSEALRINPNSAAAYQNRGVARRESGDKPGAIQDFQKAADLFQQQGDKDSYEKAINILRRLQ